MIVKEYGKSNKDVIILLHGGGLSWWNYEEVSEILKSNYHVILPILDGHSGSDRDFTSIENNANEIIEYIDNNYNGNVKLIGGLSLGAQILLDILSKRDNICEYAIIESALVCQMKMTNRLIEPSINMSYGLIKKRWFSKLQFKSLKIKKELFDKYYIDSSNITKNNMISFLKANSNYHLKNIKTNKSKSIVIVGSKERLIMIKSAKRIHDELINSELEILSGYYHGDLSINHPNEYAEKVKKLIK
jgi:hypothetical protein